MRFSILIILGLLCMLVSVPTSMAAILVLENEGPGPVTYEGNGGIFDEIQKTGSGNDIVPVDMSIVGATQISEGTIQFTGSRVVLQNVGNIANVLPTAGDEGTPTASTLIVGDDNHTSYVSAASVKVGTLKIGIGSKLVIEHIPVTAPVVPEPTSLLVWAFIGTLVLLLPYYLRRK
jgi:hypothetical protein